MRRQEVALASRGTLAAVIKIKISAITIGLDLGVKKHAKCAIGRPESSNGDVRNIPKIMGKGFSTVQRVKAAIADQKEKGKIPA